MLPSQIGDYTEMAQKMVEDSLDGSQTAMNTEDTNQDYDEPPLHRADSNSDLRLQLIDQRDAFLFEYEELENEVLELRALIDTMQHKIEETNRRWSRERDLKIQLEKQLMEAHFENSKMSMPEDIGCKLAHVPEPAETEMEAAQPCTPPSNEADQGRRSHISPSSSWMTTNASSGGEESPKENLTVEDSPRSVRSSSSIKDSANGVESHLSLALEAQIALATLREEHRNVIAELVEAKLQIATMSAEKECASKSSSDEGHFTRPAKNDSSDLKISPPRRWFSAKKL